MLRRTILGWVVMFVVILALGGCVTTTTLEPTVTITSIKTPVERSNEEISDFVKYRITNPSNETYRVYLEWIELDNQGNTVWSGRGGEFYLYPGYDQEISSGALFPPEDYQPGLYTLVIRLTTSDDNTIISEDRANFELE